MADLKISELASANVVNKDDLFYLIQDNDSYNVKASTLFSSITDPTLAGNILLGGTVQTLNAAGTVSITTTRTDLYGGRSADANAISNGSILPSTIFLYTEDVSATGRGFTFANGTPTTQTLYVRYKNDKIHLSQADSTVFTYPPEDWVGPTGLRPFPTGLQFVKGSQYIFNVSDPSNTGNVLALSSSIDGTNTLGTRYTANVVYNGTPGTAGANVVFTVANVDIDPGGKFYLDLPQGADGQLKIINLVTTLGGQFVLASNIQNNLAIELKRSGDSAFLMYSSNGWILVGSNPGLTTTFSGTSDDISEGSKLYFTNARARAAITAIDNTITYYKANGGIAANIQAITENIVAVAFSGNTNIINEGSENLYYTNNRVLSNVSQMSINVLADVDTTGITSNGTLIWNGTSFVAGIANEAYSAVVSNVSQTSNIANVVLTIDTFSTSNLREGSNLYYTNARVYANVIPLLDLKANVVDLTTANVAELNNLYYTNARVISALVGQDIVTNNVIIQGDLTVEGNVVTFNTATLTVEDKNIVLANGAINSSAADGSGFNIDGAQANLKYRSTGDKFEFNKSLDVQGTLTANGWANLYAANVIGLTTANVAELTNLYYTNARVYSNVIPLLDLKANVVDLTTANVAEGTNLYFTNARVLSNVSQMSINVLADVDVTGITANGTLIWNGTSFVAGIANEAYSAVTSNVSQTSNIANVVLTIDTFTTSNLREGSNLYFTNTRVIDALTTANVTTGNLVVSGTLTARSNVGLTLGTATQGNLISNAITMTVDTTVTNGIAQLNEILGKLVPAAPIAFPGNGYIAINSVSTFRMANFAQTDNTPSSRNVGGANIVSLVRRASSYTTTTMNDMGPGNTGTVTLYKNGSATGARTLVTGSDNGTYGDLVISDNVDYATKTGAAGGFWESFDTNASGTVSAGWNEVYINHSQGGSSNIAYWYYDSSSPGAVVFSVPVIYPTSNVYSNSSTIPHYTSATVFTMTANVKNLSGDMFPTSNTFITGSSATGFGTPSSLNYESAGVTGVPLPLTRNLYVSSGNAQISTTVNIASGFGTTTVGPSLTGQNSYISGTGSFSLGATVLYKTATISSESTMEESNIWVQGNVGSGAGYGARIINPGSTDTPVQSASALLFNSNTSTLLSYDATIVGATLKHDQTNYSVGYLPVGPNLSSGRGGAQYYTFKFSRASVGKFNIKFIGQLAGLWVALPGSAIDTTAAATNGWVDMSVAYPGSGVPSYGCALGGTVTLNTAGTQSKTCTFGSANSSDSGASGEIYIRIRLNAGQTITALAILGASN